MGMSLEPVFEKLSQIQDEILKQQGQLLSEVPAEYRLYVKEEELSKLPKGVKVYRGSRGGLYVDRRELGRLSVSEESLVESKEREGGREEGLKLYEKIYNTVERMSYKVKSFNSVFRFSRELESLAFSRLIDSDNLRNILSDIQEKFSDESHIIEEFKKVIKENIDELRDVGSGVLVQELGVDSRVAKSIIVPLAVMRGYASNDNVFWARVVEEIDKRVHGNDRPIRQLRHSWNIKVAKVISDLISGEEYESWKRFCREMFIKYHRKDKKRIKLYRGLSDFEGGQIIINLINGKKTRIKGSVQSFTTNFEIAETFGKNRVFGFVVSVYESGDRVVGGWWNASSNYDEKEQEIVLRVDSGGLDINLEESFGFNYWIPAIEAVRDERLDVGVFKNVFRLPWMLADAGVSKVDLDGCLNAISKLEKYVDKIYEDDSWIDSLDIEKLKEINVKFGDYYWREEIKEKYVLDRLYSLLIDGIGFDYASVVLERIKNSESRKFSPVLGLKYSDYLKIADKLKDFYNRIEKIRDKHREKLYNKLKEIYGVKRIE